MYKRFFAFGCSYTKYLWPTWADIIAEDLSIEYHNYARPGFGNIAIQSEIIKADLEHKFDQDDLVIVIWSHWNREDRFINGQWQAHGNIFNNEYYDPSFIKKYWSFDNDIIKNATAIISINKAYRDIIKFQCSIMPPGDFESIDKAVDKNSNDLFRFYFDALPKEIFNDKEPYFFDGHPSIMSYLDYLKYSIYPSLGLTLNSNTVIKYEKLDSVIKDVDRNSKIKHKHEWLKKTLKEFDQLNLD